MTEPTEAQPSEPEAPEPERTRRWRKVLGGSRAALAAGIALVAGGVGLLFEVFPALRPDPRDRVGGTIEVFSVESGVPRSSWLQDAFPKDVDGATKRILGLDDPSPSELALPGTVVYLKVEVDGYKRREIAIRARLYNARTQRRVPNFPTNYADAGGIQIDAPNRRTVQQLFLPDLRGEQPAFLRIELVDPESGTPIAITDSPRIVDGRISR